jgi:hypothetical protein
MATFGCVAQKAASAAQPTHYRISSLGSPGYGGEESQALSGGGVSRVPIEKTYEALFGGGESRAHYRGGERSSGAVELPQRSPPPHSLCRTLFLWDSVCPLSRCSVSPSELPGPLSCSQFRISLSLMSSIFSPSFHTCPLLPTIIIHIMLQCHKISKDN